jgi:hypothetical protein
MALGGVGCRGIQFALNTHQDDRCSTVPGSGGLASAVIYLRYELNDCRCYAPDQKAKYDDDDRFRDWPTH